MKFIIEKWDVNEFISKKNEIDPKPQFQRTEVWNKEKKGLLIDSILRGYDIPKIYLTFNEVKNQKGYHFEVVDGQQRLLTIWQFRDDKFTLPKKSIVDTVDVGNMRYSALPDSLKSKFLSYEIAVTNIIEHGRGEINTLFTRLQKGVKLIPVELRHAMDSAIGRYISEFVENQQSQGFFADTTKISKTRFKHQDYIDHLITLMHFNNSKDLKAQAMSELYFEFESSESQNFQNYFLLASNILEIMRNMNSLKKGIFKNKWFFVDVFNALWSNHARLGLLNVEMALNVLDEFDRERLKYHSFPERLIQDERHKYGMTLYKYILAFKIEAAKKESIELRKGVILGLLNGLFQEIK